MKWTKLTVGEIPVVKLPADGREQHNVVLTFNLCFQLGGWCCSQALKKQEKKEKVEGKSNKDESVAEKLYTGKISARIVVIVPYCGLFADLDTMDLYFFPGPRNDPIANWRLFKDTLIVTGIFSQTNVLVSLSFLCYDS